MPTISQLASDTVPNDNDLLVTVDVSAGTTKNITREDFFTGAPLPAGSVTQDALSDTGWKAMPPAANYSNGSFGEYRVIAGIVHLRGAMVRNTGNVTSGDAIFTLPAECAIGLNGQAFVTPGATGATVKTDFRNTIPTTVTGVSGTTTYLRLDGIIYTRD